MRRRCRKRNRGGEEHIWQGNGSELSSASRIHATAALAGFSPRKAETRRLSSQHALGGVTRRTTFPRVHGGSCPGWARLRLDQGRPLRGLTLQGGRMATPSEDHPHKTAPAKPLTDLDFRSGVQIAELNQLIQEYEARTQAVWDAPELHQTKDVVFSLLGQVQQSDGKLPMVNRYLILSGGIQQGTVNLDVSNLVPFAPGCDYDADFTLLVPVLNAAGVPVTLDMNQTPPGHARISLGPFDAATLQRWSECSSGDGTFLSAESVSGWFFRAFSAAASDLRVELRGCVTSVVVCAGPYRVLYDIVPVVAFRGWPEIAQPWLTQTHFWDGKLGDELLTAGFYLFPSLSGADWHLAFSASELHLRKLLPLPLLQAFRAATAIVPCHRLPGLRPYHLFTLSLWSCERLPTSYLGREENAAHTLLGLLDDLLACLVHRDLPSYFLPSWNLLGGLSQGATESLAGLVAQVRADPATHLCQAVEGAKDARRLAKAYRSQLRSSAVA